MEPNQSTESRLREYASRPGCLWWFFALLVLAGATILVAALVTSDDGSPPQALVASAPASAVASPAGSLLGSPAESGCETVTDQFLAFARARGGPGQERVLNQVDRVCWEATGQLRADVNVSPDIEARSAPMTWLCGALSEYVAASGRDWNGLTAYSTRSPFTGTAFLASRSQGVACYHPGRATAPP